ncbi:UNVERIFIED_CONTAM: hypothetical protein K2H54_068453 [Gekko kuhli]
MSHQRSFCQPHLELDGSYLNIARPQTLYKNNRDGPFASAAQRCQNSHVPEASIHDGRPEDWSSGLPEHRLHRKCNNLVSPGKSKELPRTKRTPDAGQRNNERPLPTCAFHEKACSTDRSCFQEGHHSPRSPPGPHCGPSPARPGPSLSSGLNSSMGSGSKEEGRGKRLSEERRKQLLLQKMELEIEKERLQNLLAEKEAKLLLQQQQLYQSRLAYDRCKGHLPNSEDLLVDSVLMRPGRLARAMNSPGGVLRCYKTERKGFCEVTIQSEKETSGVVTTL